MTRRFIEISFPVFAVTALALAGCGTAPSAAPATGTAVEHKEGDGHDHGEAGHDHAAHAHPSEGPHHGHLMELGQEEYHAELTHDDATKTVTVYLLDKEAKAPVAIADAEIMLNLVVDGKPLQAILAAAPQEGDPAGQASRFSIIDEKVLEALEAPKTTGRLNVTIVGKAYTGSVEHHEHGEHKH
jgi:hypothetical protein